MTHVTSRLTAKNRDQLRNLTEFGGMCRYYAVLMKFLGFECSSVAVRVFNLVRFI